MTGYTVHTGSTEKFSDGWDRIFRGKSAKTSAGKKVGSSKSGKRAAVKRKSRKKKA
ncbi:MAG: hypothetical protein ACE5KM_18080 [Planctomycetaceae bacterium]